MFLGNVEPSLFILIDFNLFWVYSPLLAAGLFIWLTHKTEVHCKIKLLIEPGRNDQDNIRYDSYKSFMKIISYPMSSLNA